MIYYIVIANNGNIDCATVGTLINRAITNHNDIGAPMPKIVNEMICSLVITDIAALAKIHFNIEDEVRLCLQDGSLSYPRRNCLDISNIDRISQIFKSLKEKSITVNKMVVYV